MGEGNLLARLSRGSKANENTDATAGKKPPAAQQAAGAQRTAQAAEPKRNAAASAVPARSSAPPAGAASPSKPAAARPQQPQQQAQAQANNAEDLDDVVRRVRELTSGSEATAASPAPKPSAGPETPLPARGKKPTKSSIVDEKKGFIPIAPNSFLEARLTESEVEALILKFLLSRGDAAGRTVADQLALPFRLIEELLIQMKRDQLVAHRGSAPMNDYVYMLSDIGRERARRYSDDCSYFGAAPVALADYIESVKAQSLNGQKATEKDLKRAFSDLLIDPKLLKCLGPAINSGRGMFLYGAPGNGKTSIAERVTGCFGKHIWVPRALGVDGDVIRFFDPVNHVEAPLESNDSIMADVQVDKRWIRVERPTIVVGGELTMDNLEVSLNTSTGISEAPMQLKSNCGTLVIDDFGRQRMSVDELLNRWIVPLEKRYDFLNLASGKKLQVPFDQLVIFSTNLEPRDLVDEAFLRRIPYKIEAIDPSEEIFRKLFEIMAPKMKVEFDADALEYLVNDHYKKDERNFRNCHPRDLLLQVRNMCVYYDKPAKMTRESMDFAVSNYFSVM